MTPENPASTTLAKLAEEYGTTVEDLRAKSNVGEDVTEEQELSQLQEQNVRATWEQARNA